MYRKIIYLGIALLLCVSFVFAVDPVSRTDTLIKDQHQQTRDWCQEQWDSKEQLLKETLNVEKTNFIKEAKVMLWLDRVMLYVGVFCAMFLAMTFRHILDRKTKTKEQTIDDIPIPTPPKAEDKPENKEAEKNEPKFHY